MGRTRLRGDRYGVKLAGPAFVFAINSGLIAGENAVDHQDYRSTQ